MKKTIALLGMAAVLAVPAFSLRADDALQAKKKARKEAAVARTTATNHHANREVFYVTNQSVTGSHIPVVVERYHGRNTYSSPLVSYDQADLSRAGALDVGSELVIRDPAITFRRGH